MLVEIEYTHVHILYVCICCIYIKNVHILIYVCFIHIRKSYNIWTFSCLLCWDSNKIICPAVGKISQKLLLLTPTKPQCHRSKLGIYRKSKGTNRNAKETKGTNTEPKHPLSWLITFFCSKWNLVYFGDGYWWLLRVEILYNSLFTNLTITISYVMHFSINFENASTLLVKYRSTVWRIHTV